MLFNTLHFAIFLPIIFILYWSLQNRLKLQNVLLLAASYFFYACWDWRFLFLLVFSTVLDYCSGLIMAGTDNQKRRKFWLWLSIIINVGFLGIFKYYNFFSQSFSDALSILGFQVNPGTLDVILPVGISFYTFHGLSYVLDVYKNKTKAEKNFIDYSVFVSFFPLLVAGPIERATHLLPQLKTERTFNKIKAVDGLKQILWGLFKKAVIADQCAKYVNLTFDNPQDYEASTLILGAILFAFQIYGDFSGYSDIALGVARLFGIELLRNFAFPYFSRDIAEFWRRWHISLSSWFRDYLYIPLGGSKGSNFQKIRNILIIFLVSGFWHGANWTFIFWGLLNAIYILPSVLLNTNRHHLEIVGKGKFSPGIKDIINIVATFCLTVFAWIFFRAQSLEHAFQYISGIFSTGILHFPEFLPLDLLSLIAFFMMIEWLGRDQQFALANLLNTKPKLIRWGFYYILIVIIFVFAGSSQEFIYFQF
jgi:D-alanyl-lipoteichoic acid acyltransferase DltB (MBOAT superfamily)